MGLDDEEPVSEAPARRAKANDTLEWHERLLQQHEHLLLQQAAQLAANTTKLAVIEATITRVETTLGGDKVLGTPGTLAVIAEKLDALSQQRNAMLNRQATILAAVIGAIAVVLAATITLLNR